VYKNLKLKARQLRLEGKSIREIERELQVARSNVSNWVRDVELTKVQLDELALRSHSKITIEKRRESRLKNEAALRMPYILEGRKDINQLESVDLFMLSLGIFMGEGGKTNRGSIQLSNTDPRIIQIFVKFLLNDCGFQIQKLHGHVGIHRHLNRKAAEMYWSKISGIPLSQFMKTTYQHSKRGKGERDKLPYGTFSIVVHDTKKRIKLEGWIQGVYQRLFPHNTDLHHVTKLKV